MMRDSCGKESRVQYFEASWSMFCCSYIKIILFLTKLPPGPLIFCGWSLIKVRTIKCFRVQRSPSTILQDEKEIQK